MTDELWRQWQELAARWAPASWPSAAANTWKSAPGVAAFADGADRFKAAAQSFLDGAASGSAATAAQAAQRFGEFLRDQFSGAPMPWSADIEAAPPGGAARTSAFDAPALGATREQQLRWQRMGEAWQRIDGAQRRLQRLWADTLREAAAAFTAQCLQRPMPDPAAQPPGPEVPLALYDAWIDCAEQAYARMAHGEAFGSAQAEFVNASGQWRQELQALIEQWAKLLDLPTRSEVSTLSRRLKSVEERLRAGAPAAQHARGAQGPSQPRASQPRASQPRAPQPDTADGSTARLRKLAKPRGASRSRRRRPRP